MAEVTTEASQRLAARIAGFTLLFLMISGLTGMFIFDRHLVVAGDAAGPHGTFWRMNNHSGRNRSAGS